MGIRGAGMRGVLAGGWRRVFPVAYPRHRLDVSLRDVLFGIQACARLLRRGELEGEILARGSLEGEGMVCLSVRTGFDLLLGALGLREGDEVLVSAITHPDMVRVIGGHGLRAVPVDVDPETLAPRPELLGAAATSRTRAVVVAHLFGGRVDLGPVARFAADNGLMVIEDCAQAFAGPGGMGDPRADVSMYSFGTLKTSTAFGGAVLRVRDRRVLAKMRRVEAGYPVQGRGEYLKKLLEGAMLILASRPGVYGGISAASDALGLDLDALLKGVGRGFPGTASDEAFFRRIRRRPAVPLLALLDRRLRAFDPARLERRAAAGERMMDGLPAAFEHPGRRALWRKHWIFPVVAPRPDDLVRRLRREGFDASRATSSIAAVEPPARVPAPAEANRVMSGMVFLPVYPGLAAGEWERLIQLLRDHVGERDAPDHAASDATRSVA